MPTLSRWFTAEYQRLTSEGKGPLIDCFETLRAAFFEEDVPTVRMCLPRVYQLSDSFGEAAWHLAADYYGILLEMIWHGDLARGLDLGTQAMIRSARVLEPGTPLEWYLRETLLDAWLSTDGPGFAPDVLTAIDEIGMDGLPGDVAARLAIVRAYAETQIDPGCGEEALRTVLGVLPGLSWEQGYCLRLRALGLTWAGRFAEAALDYEAACLEFEGMGYRIAANDSRLAMGDALIQAGDAQAGLETLRAALSAAERLPNRAHAGMAMGGIGQALIALGQAVDGCEWLGAALQALDGLGWLRIEAEYSLARLRASQTVDLPEWQTIYGDAQRRVGRLRSADLRQALDALAG